MSDLKTAREIISMDGNWEFAYTKTAPDLENVEFPTAEKYEVSIPVPAYWDDCKQILKFAKWW